jgi:hypothetical protein
MREREGKCVGGKALGEEQEGKGREGKESGAQGDWERKRGRLRGVEEMCGM